MKLLFVCLFSMLSTWAHARSKPNVIYIYLDDMGYGELGCYGQQKIQTPHIDRMAAEGMRFTQHYTGAPVCAPARAIMLTGLHAGHSSIRGNYELGGFADSVERGQMPLPAGSFTIGHLMKNAGYSTAAIGKWGLGMHYSTGSPAKQGFDYFYGYYCQKQAHNFYPTHLWQNDVWDTLQNPYIYVHRPLQPNAAKEEFDYFIGTDYSITKMTEKALTFIQQNKERPFFLYLPFTGPHVSLQAPQIAIHAYLGRFAEKPYYGNRGYASTLYPLSTYAAMISYTDAQIGKIMATLKELGIDHNTLILFSSDNGSTFNVGGVDVEFFNLTAGLRGRKMDLYEGGIRVPMIARWPKKIKAGTVTPHISTQYDIMATLAQLTGSRMPTATDGISFLPTLLNKQSKQKKHDYLYFEYPEKGGQIAIRYKNFKGVKSNLKKNPHSAWEIFDLQADPFEAHDIAAAHLDLQKLFSQFVRESHSPSQLPQWEFVKE